MGQLIRLRRSSSVPEVKPEQERTLQDRPPANAPPEEVVLPEKVQERRTACDVEDIQSVIDP